MSTSPDDTNVLVQRALQSDQSALAALFARHRKRLKRMVTLRMDNRLVGKVDASDVLRATYLDLAARLAEYAADPNLPFFVWLRLLTGQRLTEVQREHLGTIDDDLQVSLRRGPLQQVSTVFLASRLLGRFKSSAGFADRADIQLKLQEALNGMPEADREILALRHFEELTNEETARVLNVSGATASTRYLGALWRLKESLAQIPGMFDQ